jgi:hypothetical protein
MIVMVAAVACAGCGESRLPSSVTGGTGGIGGAGNSGGAGCSSDTTVSMCLGKGTAAAVLAPQVNVASTRTIVHVAIPVEYSDAPAQRAQAFEVWLQSGSTKYFFHPNGSCPVVPDIPGLTGTRLRDLGNLTGLPPGQYVLMVGHGLLDPCYTPPSDADTSQSNYLVFETGTLTVCN